MLLNFVNYRVHVQCRYCDPGTMEILRNFEAIGALKIESVEFTPCVEVEDAEDPEDRVELNYEDIDATLCVLDETGPLVARETKNAEVDFMWNVLVMLFDGERSITNIEIIKQED